MPNTGLAIRRVDGNVVTASAGRVAWYTIPATRWSFRSTAEREQLILSAATRLASLTGHRLHYRVTTRPLSVDRWARGLDELVSSARLPGFAEHLIEEQRALLGLTLSDKLVYLGVSLNAGTGRRHADAARNEARELDSIVAGQGLDGTPGTAVELEYLLHRSVTLGAPAPLTLAPPREAWDGTDDLDEVTDRATWSAAPFARSTTVTADANGAQVVRHVVTLTLGRMTPLSIPEAGEPWMLTADRLPFPVEWAATFDVLGAEPVQKDVTSALARIRSQVEHFRADHGLDAPTLLARQRDRALAIEEEVSGFSTLATRAHGWVRAAVSGSTEAEALDRARQLAELYAPAITLTRPPDTYRLAREFIPGEPVANTSHKRRLPVTTLAAAVPSATAMVGDGQGFFIGRTTGTSERAVLWFPWRSMEVRERSGLTAIVGTLGAGKSVLLGVLVYQSVLAGVRAVVLDPSGPLARLVEVPTLAPYSRAVDLMSAAPGALSPYRVVGEPLRSQCDSEDEWRRAQAMAEAQRRSLALDVLLMLLPAGIGRMPETRMVLSRAVKLNSGQQVASTRQVLVLLRQTDDSHAEHARYVADELEAISEMPQAQLIFPTSAEALHRVEDDDYRLQVLTMRGNVLPPVGKPREELSVEETLGVPLLHLAAHLTSRSIYSRNMSERKLVGLDEVHALSDVASGRALINRIARDSRKYNLRALIASQNAADLTVAGIANFVDSVFVGQTTGADAQREALALAGVETGVGYEAVLGTLSPQDRRAITRSGYREHLFSDGEHGIERIRVHLPAALAQVLDTTASPDRVAAPRVRRPSKRTTRA